MAIKKVWVTWMPEKKETGDPAGGLAPLKQYGLQVSGARWVNDLKQMTWAGLGTTLLDPAQADSWLIAGTRKDFENRENRYALSLLAALVREGRGPDFPVYLLALDEPMESEQMPFLTRTFRWLQAREATWPAKVLTAHLKTQARPWPFRLNVHGHPFVGQWFEVGPREGVWEGALFGVSEGSQITYHLVGPKGQLPERATLEYPTEGIRAEIQGRGFTAFSVRNRIGPEASYYVRVEGYPDLIFFGGSPGDEAPEVTIVDLI